MQRPPPPLWPGSAAYDPVSGRSTAAADASGGFTLVAEAAKILGGSYKDAETRQSWICLTRTDTDRHRQTRRNTYTADSTDTANCLRLFRDRRRRRHRQRQTYQWNHRRSHCWSLLQCEDSRPPRKGRCLRFGQWSEFHTAGAVRCGDLWCAFCALMDVRVI